MDLLGGGRVVALLLARRQEPHDCLEVEAAADEVRGECARHGTVLHLQCDKWSNGFIYLKLLSHPEAARLRDTMHGRYFAKNKILAELVPEATYNKKWKLQ